MQLSHKFTSHVPRPDFCSHCGNHTGDPLKRLCKQCLHQQGREFLAKRLEQARSAIPVRFHYVLANRPLPIEVPDDYYNTITGTINHPCSLTITGPSGVGKTTIAAWVARCIISLAAQGGPNCLHWRTAEGLGWVYTPEYCQALNAAPLGTVAAVGLQARRASLLVIDDLGAEGIDSLSNKHITALLGSRFDSALPTIVTTGLTDKQIISRYGSGIHRRFFSESTVLSWFQEAAE